MINIRESLTNIHPYTSGDVIADGPLLLNSAHVNSCNSIYGFYRTRKYGIYKEVPVGLPIPKSGEWSINCNNSDNSPRSLPKTPLAQFKSMFGRHNWRHIYTDENDPENIISYKVYAGLVTRNDIPIIEITDKYRQRSSSDFSEYIKMGIVVRINMEYVRNHAEDSFCKFILSTFIKNFNLETTLSNSYYYELHLLDRMVSPIIHPIVPENLSLEERSIQVDAIFNAHYEQLINNIFNER